jgi:hypothetical protein
MKSIVTGIALLLAAGSFAGASERAAIREATPAAVIAQFSQAIPPEPPVVGELPEHHQQGTSAQCCRMNASKAPISTRAAAPCACCQKTSSGEHAKHR